MFKKAERKKLKLKLAITGPSGSGKTYSALRLATGLGGKIAVIDTENGSASLYSDKFDFDVLELTPPYTVDRYLTAMKAAEKAGYSILIVDSISHQWKGEGGVLNQKEQMDSRGGNSFQNWGKLTPEQDRFMAGILHANVHMICTMRSKQDYIMQENDKGKQAPKKVGLAPIQRDGMEYEFTTVLDVAMNHEAVASKDRTGLFVDKTFKITEETGQVLVEWLSKGDDYVPNVETAQTSEPPPLKDETVDPPKQKQNIDHGEIVNKFGKKFKDIKIKEIPDKERKEMIEWLKEQQAAGEFKIPSANDFLFHAQEYSKQSKN